MSVSIVTVNYNSGACLGRMADSALRQIGAADSLVVVDNASVDDSLERLAPLAEKITAIANMENRGFARAVNQGAAAAVSDFILLLNPDAVIAEGALRALESFMVERPDAGVAGGKVLETDGSLQLACRRGFPSPWVAFCRLSGLSFLFPRSRLLAGYNMTFLDENETSEVDAVSGSFMMIRRSAFDSLGGFDEDYFLYAEDIDFCYRAKAAGMKVYYYPGAEATHEKGVCAASAPGFAKREFYKTMWTFHSKHYKRKTLPPLNWLIWAAANALALAAPALARLSAKSGRRRVKAKRIKRLLGKK